MKSLYTTTTDLEMRQQKIKSLAHALNEDEFKERLIRAYLEDTAFTYSNIYEREILSPTAILRLLCNSFDGDNIAGLKERKSIGKVAILLPKNGIGLIIAKALASSYLMGNYSVVKIPSQLSTCSEIYSELILSHLDKTEFVSPSISSREFLKASLENEEIKAVVVYGDDSWIDSYVDLARATGTKLIFEGPGNDPQIVYPDSDIEKAANDAITCGLMNGGQSCSAFERFFVHDKVHDRFVYTLSKKLNAIKQGNPADPSVKLGPVKSQKILTRIKHQINEAVDLGGKIVLGGERFNSIFKDMEIVAPTVIANCHVGMSVVKEETFGPVFPIIRFNDDTAALIHDVDQSNYGLNASVYGSSPVELNRYLQSFHRNFYHDSSYACSINVASKLNDGGCKNSGFITELKNGVHVKRTGKRFLIQELSIEQE